jgi:LysM repeat protein
VIVIGNALGNSIVEKATPQASTPATMQQSGSGFDQKASEAVGANNFYGADVSGFAKDLDFNPNIDYTPGSVSGDESREVESASEQLKTSVTAQSGDSISKIVGTSNPKAIEAFMRANNLSSSAIQAGQSYKMPSAADYEASDGRIGQTALNVDNQRLTATTEALATAGTFMGDMRLAQANGVSMDDIAAARTATSTTPQTTQNSLSLGGEKQNSEAPFELGATDFVGAGLGGYSVITDKVMEYYKVESAGKFGIKYGIPAIVSDLPSAVGGAIGLIDVAKTFYKAREAGEGDYKETVQKAGGTLGGIAGAETGAAAGALFAPFDIATAAVGAIAGGLYGSYKAANTAGKIYDQGFEGVLGTKPTLTTIPHGQTLQDYLNANNPLGSD